MSKDLISVVLPVKNCESTISSAILSILNQSYSNFELIIVDDGSNDKTARIIKNIEDSRITLYERENKGIVKQLNFGISVSNGDFIARMDGDDLSLPTRFELQISVLKNSAIDICGTNIYLVNNKKRILKRLPEIHEDIEYMMPILTCMVHPTIMVKRQTLFRVNLYDESILFSEDHNLYLRLLMEGAKFYNIQIPLLEYRLNANSHSQKELVEHKRQHYINGVKYFNYLRENEQTSEKRYDQLFRIGLLKYYNDQIISARKLFVQQIIKNPKSILKVIRYLLPSCFGRVLLFFRRKNILRRVNFFLIDKIGFDSHILTKSK